MVHYLLAVIFGFLGSVLLFPVWADEDPPAAGPTTQARQNQSRFTPPPGEETEPIKKLIARAEGALSYGKTGTEILSDTDYLPAHEWPRFRKIMRQAGKSSRATIVTPQEPGEPLVVAAQVVNGQGRPVTDATVYVYHTSAKGWYSDRAAHIAAHEGDRRHARLFGYLTTNKDGRFELRTIRPGGYPNAELPAHIHVEIESGKDNPTPLATEIQFDDDPRLTPEMRRRSRQEGFVIGKIHKSLDGVQRMQVEIKIR